MNSKKREVSASRIAELIGTVRMYDGDDAISVDWTTPAIFCEYHYDIVGMAYIKGLEVVIKFVLDEGIALNRVP